MIKNHPILLGIAGSFLLLFIATLCYPGGSQNDLNAPGFSWQHNYLSNLFDQLPDFFADCTESNHFMAIAWILGLTYFTTKADFERMP